MKTEQTILEELKELAPQLASLSKEEGYGLPQGYWERLEQSVLQEIEVEQISFPEEAQGSVPEGYFDGLNAHIFDKIDSEIGVEKPSAGSRPQIFSLARKLKPLMGIAASLLLVALVVLQIGKPDSSASQQASLNEFMENAEVFNDTELAFLTGDLDDVIYEASTLESLAEENEVGDEMDDLLEEFFEDEELNELLS